MCVQVLSSDNPKYGYNAATGQYEDLMAAGIIDPTKVICLEVTFSNQFLCLAAKFSKGKGVGDFPHQGEVMQT